MEWLWRGLRFKSRVALVWLGVGFNSDVVIGFGSGTMGWALTWIGYGVGFGFGFIAAVL